MRKLYLLLICMGLILGACSTTPSNDQPASAEKRTANPAATVPTVPVHDAHTAPEGNAYASREDRHAEITDVWERIQIGRAHV